MPLQQMNLEELNQLIMEYGYAAIFLFVFLQEIGIPNPLTNELVLLFSGYLAYSGVLITVKVFFVAVSADFTGTSIVYLTFYLIGKQYIFKQPPKALQKLAKRIEKLKQRIDTGNQWTIFLGRLTPFLRGYVSVAVGVLQIKPRAFLTTVFLSAITWSGGLVLTGRILGYYWSALINQVGVVGCILLFFSIIVILIILGRYVISRQLSKD